MKNRELLIHALEDGEDYDFFDDGGATTESVIAYHIDCPYTSTEGHPCDGEVYPWDTLDVCGPCKMEWLDKEVSR